MKSIAPTIIASLAYFCSHAFAAPDVAEAPMPAFKGTTIDQWHGFNRQKFQVDGCNAWVVEPEVMDHAKEQPEIVKELTALHEAWQKDLEAK